MAKPTNYRGIHITVTYDMGYNYYEIPQINKGKKWNDKILFSTLKEAKMYIDEHYDELIKNESKKSARKSLKEAQYIPERNHGKGYDALIWILLDIAEWGEKVIHKDCTIEDGRGGLIFRGRLYEYYIINESKYYFDNLKNDLTTFDIKYGAWEELCNDYMDDGFHDKGTPIEIQQLLHKKELWELVEVANYFVGEQNIIELKPTRELVNWAEKNYNYV